MYNKILTTLKIIIFSLIIFAGVFALKFLAASDISLAFGETGTNIEAIYKSAVTGASSYTDTGVQSIDQCQMYSFNCIVWNDPMGPISNITATMTLPTMDASLSSNGSCYLVGTNNGIQVTASDTDTHTLLASAVGKKWVIDSVWAFSDNMPAYNNVAWTNYSWNVVNNTVYFTNFPTLQDDQYISLRVRAKLDSCVTTGTVGDTVFIDENADGIQNGNDAGIANVCVELVNSSNTVVATTNTNSSGQYIFNNIPFGTYTVKLTCGLPAGYINSTNNASGDSVSISVIQPSDLTADFGYTPKGTIGDTVWYDLDRSGTQNAEVGIPNVTVGLFNQAGNQISTTVTDINGNYLFTNLLLGNYTVKVISGVPATYVNTTGNAVGASVPISITNLNNLTGDFGYALIITSSSTTSSATSTTSSSVSTTSTATSSTSSTSSVSTTASTSTSATPTGTIGDTVFLDVDRNGVQNGSEAGLPNICVELVNASGNVVMTTTTNSIGNYLFSNVPYGTYTVKLTCNVPNGYNNTTANANGSVVIINATNPNNLTADFGYAAPVTSSTSSTSSASTTSFMSSTASTTSSTASATTSSISSTVSTTSSSTSVTTSSMSSTVSTTSSSASATTSSMSSSATTTTSSSSSVSTTSTSSISSITSSTSSSAAPTGTIGDTVFIDLNGNGIIDNNETGIPNVCVSLLNSANVVIATTTTNAQGIYSFTNLPIGSYKVVVTCGVPTNYINTTNNLSGHVIGITLANLVNNTADFGFKPKSEAKIDITKIMTESSNTQVKYKLVIKNTGDTTVSDIRVVDNYNVSMMTLSTVSVALNENLKINDTLGRAIWYNIGSLTSNEQKEIALTFDLKQISGKACNYGFSIQGKYTDINQNYTISKDFVDTTSSLCVNIVVIEKEKPTISVVKTNNTKAVVSQGDLVEWKVEIKSNCVSVCPDITNLAINDTFDTNYLTYTSSLIRMVDFNGSDIFANKPLNLQIVNGALYNSNILDGSVGLKSGNKIIITIYTKAIKPINLTTNLVTVTSAYNQVSSSAVVSVIGNISSINTGPQILGETVPNTAGFNLLHLPLSIKLAISLTVLSLLAAIYLQYNLLKK